MLLCLLHQYGLLEAVSLFHVLQDSTAYQRESLLYAEDLGQVCI